MASFDNRCRTTLIRPNAHAPRTARAPVRSKGFLTGHGAWGAWASSRNGNTRTYAGSSNRCCCESTERAT
ncbi:hypothetical protein IF1G_03887 [Cordyceps javanica]|uniref:Uncharacterized protein n=1 Tax=Cordyceps javanica TaxID=43265 RepID=A0A545V8T9_9HYPO|nr:hypothetical protein IF1G_03887 [Cordyceps javanica]